MESRLKIRSQKDRDRAAQVQHILAILHKWGIHTLGQLAALPKEELRARLGSEAVRLWERAQGKSSRLLKWVQPPESFIEIFEFEMEIETAEPLLFMLRRFLEQLALRLAVIYLLPNELVLQISFTNKQKYERRFQIPQPTNDIDILFRILQTHLEDFKSQHPIVAVSLEAFPARPAPQQFGLFETALRNPNRLLETLARLNALLGKHCVGTPVLEETHRPDAFRMKPFVWQIAAIDLNRHLAERKRSTLNGEERKRSTLNVQCSTFNGEGRSPALRRFRPAARLSLLKPVNGSSHLQSEKRRGKIRDQRGPYLISGNWWDEKAWGRAEWDLELENGIVCRCHRSDQSWEVDGIYD